MVTVIVSSKAQRGWHPLRAMGICGDGCINQICRVENPQRIVYTERKLSATGYVEWVLGDLRTKSVMRQTESDPITGALFAHNAYNTEFSDRIAFFDVDAANRTLVATAPNSLDATVLLPIRQR